MQKHTNADKDTNTSADTQMHVGARTCTPTQMPLRGQEDTAVSWSVAHFSSENTYTTKKIAVCVTDSAKKGFNFYKKRLRRISIQSACQCRHQFPPMWWGSRAGWHILIIGIMNGGQAPLNSSLGLTEVINNSVSRRVVRLRLACRRGGVFPNAGVIIQLAFPHMTMSFSTTTLIKKARIWPLKEQKLNKRTEVMDMSVVNSRRPVKRMIIVWLFL